MSDSSSSVPDCEEKQQLRPHPPRLQHSPSMPNIWFPPHSGPIPARLTEACGEFFQRQPTPPTNDVKAADASIKDIKTPAVPSAAEEPSRGPNVSLSPQNSKRRRMHPDQPNVLLTPPLTPSGSIRTSASIESTTSPNTGLDLSVAEHQRPARERNIGFSDPDTISTRFLLLRRVSRTVDSSTLQFAIVSSLTASTPSSHSTTPTSKVADSEASRDIANTIKGVLLRFQESHGVAVLAFFDVRQAKYAQTILSAPTSGPLADCVGDDDNPGSQRAWLDCSFVTAQDLMEMVGRSSFVIDLDGSFLLTVDVDSGSSIDGESENCQREINIQTLVDLLKSQGAVRSFGLSPGNPQTASRKVFRVEYYDVRESKSARLALHGNTYFGMHLSVPRHDPQSLDCQASLKPESSIPFPSSHIDQSSLRFEPAGHKSQIRERFLFIDTSGKIRPRSVSAGHESLEGPLTQSIAPPSDSPPFFYTSHSTISSGNIPPLQAPDSHNRRASNHLFFDAVGRPYNSVCERPQETPKRSRSVSAARDGREHELQNDSIADSVRADDREPNPSMECCYLPLERFPQPYYNGSLTPPLPPYAYPYSPHHHQLVQPGIGYPPCPVSPLGYPHEYDQAHGMNMGNWTFEQPMMIPPTPVGMYPGISYPPPMGEYWHGSPLPSPQHIAYFHHPPGLHPESSPLPKLQSPPHPPLSHAGHLPPQMPTTPSPAPPRAVSASGVAQNPNGISNNNNDRNQLNLSRIEDGQDTRTTVMIKNIPNKMSDKDLMAYIGNVCNRRIDFLYLRMDFQNGCNVGYAFVNFINVQDLLRFAKAKLGEKWNMYSSEKVLQMSYANYQGKEALVEKFKNSCIMDEKLAWQPKIFYSDGPEQGLPEPFPPPTHLRRKERSSYNRGPLYLPNGVMNGLHSSMSAHARKQAADERLALSRQPRRLRDVDDQSAYAPDAFGKKPVKK